MYQRIYVNAEPILTLIKLCALQSQYIQHVVAMIRFSFALFESALHANYAIILYLCGCVCVRVRWHFCFHVGMPIIRTRVN